MKITEEQIEFFLGKDNLENACLTELIAIANEEYSPPTIQGRCSKPLERK